MTTKTPKKLTKAQHRAAFKRLLAQPFVLATTETLPYLPHLPAEKLIRAHKLIDPYMHPAYMRDNDARGITYAPGYDIVDHKTADTNENHACGAGMNVGTVEWTRWCYQSSVKIIKAGDLLAVVEFERSHVAAFPVTGWVRNLHGKFRVQRLKVISVSVLDEAFLRDADVDRSMTHKEHIKRAAEASLHMVVAPVTAAQLVPPQPRARKVRRHK